MTAWFVHGQSGETGWTGDKPMFRVSLSERFADHLVDCLRGLTLDLASVLMQRGALNLGLAERRAAGGATELVLGEGADIAVLDRQLRAALGAAGFELPERDGGRHEASPSDDWDKARDQRAEEMNCFRTIMSGVEAGLRTLETCPGNEQPAAQRGEMADTLNRAALLMRLSFPVTEAERAAFHALPQQARADILARMLEAMRVLYQTRPDGVYFVFAAPAFGFDPKTFCLTEGPDGERHKMPDYETPWQP